ncbi:DUF2029 domain-containing protein, partial [bacterium]|nr:DUF2029 domain-containing protein [bacterium]
MPEHSLSLVSSTPQPKVGRVLLRLLIVLFWAFFATLFIKHILIYQFFWDGVDFPKHVEAARAVLENRSPYTGENYLGFNYPLLTAWLFVFLAWVPADRAEFVWDLCHAIFVFASLVIVVGAYRPRITDSKRRTDGCPIQAASWIADHWPAVGALALALFSPIFLDIHHGNIEPLNLVLLILMGALLLRGKENSAGVVLAVLCLIKIVPILLVPALWMGGKRRTVAVWTAALSAYAIVMLLTGWWRWEWFLVTETLPNIGFHY